MNLDNYQKFCDQIERAIIKYPNLSIIEKGRRKLLKGILDIPTMDSGIAGNYLIEIHFTEFFPFRFPKLFEVGGDIPNHLDWHKFSDNSCCITVQPDEILKCKSGITVLEFIENYCFSFFANHIYRKRENHYLNGEYSHGVEGIKEFYACLLKTSDSDKWINYLRYVFFNTTVKYGRNDKCFCNSGIKFKNCHLKIFESIKDIGLIQCLYDFKNIFPHIQFDF